MRGLGYLISIVSVLLLGAVAWPSPGEPRWHMTALLAGMALSIGGMGLRWLASRQQKSELHSVERRVGLRQPAE
ncbi:hypothetical protein [Sphingomonas glaciei]|uniref:Uncharacterized protein n=1 Tax=Sphingomonas glaciei TaxID=2938948 RepID=A0ABY5MXP8_9SPHN|nr:hypothetical protein [Sphingomonas glaciei]UUR09234.1 hypothetical protein M1K48_06385 [Sphingomonas glaciei]